MLGLLNSVERGGEQSQRRLASELGIALGLVNAYLKRCIKKGLIKMREAPARRYVYYLTPTGFSEKSRLTLEYLTCSFFLFRQAKKDCMTILLGARARGISRIAIIGASELAEIATVCALDLGITVVAIVDPQSDLRRLVGFPVTKSLNDVDGTLDAVLVADMKATRATVDAVIARQGAERVLIPELLGLRSLGRSEKSA